MSSGMSISRLFAATNRSSAPKQSQQQWGLTPPLSTAAPTPLEVRANECLVSLIRDHYKMFETAEGDAHRLEVLMQLDEVVQAWVRDECIKLGMGEHAISDNKPILRTFGSYRVGVHGAGTDIDLLCIAPNFVTRECFFAELLPRLRANSKVTELKGVPNAYVPVMQFKFDGVEFDLLYAPLPSAAIKNLNIFDDNILRNLDQETYLSLNGPRVTDMVLDLVPDQENYRITLRCVKLWAKKRGVHSNVIGFWSGVAWNIAVARVCQLYPRAVPAVLLEKFFKFYSKWKWPTPVMLQKIEDHHFPNLEVWKEPGPYRPSTELMPILTPAYPSKSSTYNVSESAYRIICSEFKRGAELTERMLYLKDGALDASFTSAALDTATSDSVPVASRSANPVPVPASEEQWKSTWLELFAPADFFTRYKRFVQIDVFSTTHEKQDRWRGFVETKTRLFIKSLEELPGIQAAPFPAMYPNPTVTVTDNGQPVAVCESMFVALVIPDIDMKETKPSESGSEPAVNLNLSITIADFLTMTRTARGSPFEEGMDVHVGFVKQKNLPDFVFPDGQRPGKPKKRKSAVQAPVAAVAAETCEVRSTEAADADDPTPSKKRKLTAASGSESIDKGPIAAVAAPSDSSETATSQQNTSQSG